MKREIWLHREENENKKDSLYIAAEIVKEHARSSKQQANLSYVLEQVYLKLEELRKKTTE